MNHHIDRLRAIASRGFAATIGAVVLAAGINSTENTGLGIFFAAVGGVTLEIALAAWLLSILAAAIADRTSAPAAPKETS